jgi:aspartyl-tRNA(Asn)/glutamyl-tRNA(Gln) amidotransferase subunit C
MAAEFTREQIEAVAALAELELDPSEIELFARQLDEILSYARRIQQLDTTDIPPTAHAARRHTAERDDLVKPSLPIGDVLANAPDALPEPGLFRVPRVIG